MLTVISMEPWTLDELTRRVDAVLRRDHVRQDNGQVAQAPNARAVRWYQSTGLLRRPDQRGRVAYYGPAHLAELVAIKRLQAEGLSLVEVEGRLRGLDDAALFEFAALPADIIDVPVPAVTALPASTQTAPQIVPPPRSFWDADVPDADIAPIVAVMSPSAPSSSRTAIDHAGFTLVLPAGVVADDVTASLFAALVQRLTTSVAASPSTSTSADDVDAPARESE